MFKYEFNKMRILYIIFFIIFIDNIYSQNILEWSENQIIKLEDFQSNGTQIGQTNVNNLISGVKVEFYYQMSNIEFMMTKNFNNKVSCEFDKDIALILAQDESMAENMVAFANFEFNLAELYARKIRQKLYEDKGTFSDTKFFKPIYDTLMKEYFEKINDASKKTEIGKNREILFSLLEEVKNEISMLSDFCKSCKPQKKKRK